MRIERTGDNQFHIIIVNSWRVWEISAFCRHLGIGCEAINSKIYNKKIAHGSTLSYLTISKMLML